MTLLLFKSSKIRSILISLIAVTGMGMPAMMAYGEETVAQTDVTADIFITDLVDKLRILATEEDETEGKEALRLVLAEDMATRRLQAYLLSNQQRKTLSEAEVAEYNEIFPLYISAAFAGSIDQLVSRTITVNDVIERRPGDFIVRSKLLSSDGKERAGLDWRVLERRGRKQLVDVIVDGLSFNVERRAQFTAILKNDGFDALIVHMKDVANVSPH